MKRLQLLALWAGFSLLGLATLAMAFQPASPLVAPTDPLSPADEKKGFKLPPGYEIQLVASEPDIFKPMNLAFDQKGRLWVTDSLEYPYAVKEGTKGRDSVKILSDFAPDGKPRKIETFADGLNIPIGLLPLPGKKGEPQTALVHSIPNVWKMADTNHDGKADSREPFLTGFGQRDTHGMTNSFILHWDGWIHATHGFSNDSEIKGKDATVLKLNSGNTYRYRPDGTGIRSYTRGQVNPFGMTVDAWGNFYTADCHSKPIYQLLPGAIYPSFAKPHDGLGFGPDMIKHTHFSTGIAGIAVLNANTFPPEHRGTLIIGNVVTSRVNHDRVEWKGASPNAIELPDFISNADLWFRPVDIKLGPDGALYIADFYNKVIGHYEVPLTHPGRDRHRGRIWRVVYRGLDGKQQLPPLPDFTAMSTDQLLEKLGHDNQQVRLMAGHELVVRGGQDVTGGLQLLTASRENSSGHLQRIHAMWALFRLGALEKGAVAQAMNDTEPLVRAHGLNLARSFSPMPDDLAGIVRQALSDKGVRVQIAAVHAMAAHPSNENLKALLEFRAQCDPADSHLLYATRLALREQVRDSQAWAGLPATTENERDLRHLADVALGLSGPAPAGFLAARLAAINPEGEREMALVRIIIRDGNPADKEKIVAYLKEEKRDKTRQGELLRVAAQAAQERGGKLDGPLLAQANSLCDQLLGAPGEGEVRAGADLAATLQTPGLEKALALVVQDGKRPAGARIACIQALSNLAGGIAALETAAKEANAPLEVREAAVAGLGKSLNPKVRGELVAMFPGSPARLQTALALALASTPNGARDFLTAVRLGKASARLLLERSVEVKLRQRNLADFQKELAELTKGLPPADQLLQKKIDDKRAFFLSGKGNAVKGEALFQKQCANCHQVANKGQRVGPQLDGIGARGLDRLLEDLLDPNRNVDQAFRQTTLALKNGQFVNGLLLREEGVILVLADQMGKEVRVAKDQVEERKLSPISPMPAGFVDQITQEEFADLLRYLLSIQAK